MNEEHCLWARNGHMPCPHVQREWVGLTEDEIALVTGHCGVSIMTATAVARAIEAKLKEKNGGEV